VPAPTYTRRYPHAPDDHLGPKVNMARLRSMLYEVGMRQSDFAEACHVTMKVMSPILTSKKEPTLRMRYRIAYVVHKLELDPKGEIVSGNDGFVDYTADPKAIEAFETASVAFTR
jgi:transcriptional regulator with XRE-family HTH domain